MKTKCCENLVISLALSMSMFIYFQIMVNAMRMIDFTECCHQGEYLQDIDSHSRDSESLKLYLEGVILMVTS
jgi:hypothetical protein